MSIVMNQIPLDNDEINWTSEKQSKLERYVLNYYHSLFDISQFYTNIDWSHVIDLIGIDDIEFLKLKLDEIFDETINFTSFDVENIILHWKLNSSPLKQKITNMIDSIDLKPFTEEIEEQQELVEVESRPEIKKHEMPTLSFDERRTSLELMHFMPSISELIKPATASITNVNILAGQKKKSHKPPSRPMMKQRRSSLVGEKLPSYIRKQLKNRPQQSVTPKPSKLKINEPKYTRPQDSKILEPRPRNDLQHLRLQNLTINSQSLYAHSREPDSTSTSITFQKLRNESDDDDKEYISPDSLVKYYGEQNQDDNDSDDDDVNDGEENDFVNVNGTIELQPDDDSDYLFKI